MQHKVIWVYAGGAILLTHLVQDATVMFPMALMEKFSFFRTVTRLRHVAGDYRTKVFKVIFVHEQRAQTINLHLQRTLYLRVWLISHHVLLCARV